jgi:hypothetical protein
MAILTPDVAARSAYVSDPTTVALSTSTARNSSALKAGAKYQAWATVAWFFKHGGSSVTAALTSVPLNAGDIVTWKPESGVSDYIAGILSASTGTLYIVEVT